MKYKNALLLMFLCCTIFAQDAEIEILLNNGNKITGEIIAENDSELTLKTEFGTLVIPRADIAEIYQPGEKPVEPVTELEVVEPEPEFNQEARWRTIYSSMLLGNGLYGVGIPYVLGIEDTQLASGLRLLMFGGGFYASLRYTKQMDLPMGRWQLQMAGAQMGGTSIFPLMALVGFENWWEFDNDGKLMMTYIMAATPYGIWKADQYYYNRALSNGQAALIAGSFSLGALNTIGAISIIHQDDWGSENLARFYTLLTYGGALTHGYFADKIITRREYSEDDAVFLTASAGTGLLNSMMLLGIIDPENHRIGIATMMLGTNGFIYLADRMLTKTSLRKGQGRIVMLGTGAAYMTWIGTTLIFNINYDTDFARIMDMASLTAGWYYTFKWVSKNNPTTRIKQDSYLAISPAVVPHKHKLLPGLNIQYNF